MCFLKNLILDQDNELKTFHPGSHEARGGEESWKVRQGLSDEDSPSQDRRQEESSSHNNYLPDLKMNYSNTTKLYLDMYQWDAV